MRNLVPCAVFELDASVDWRAVHQSTLAYLTPIPKDVFRSRSIVDPFLTMTRYHPGPDYYAVKILLRSSWSPEKNGGLLLWKAARDGRTDIIRLSLADKRVQLSCQSDRDPLCAALDCDNREVAGLLLDDGRCELSRERIIKLLLGRDRAEMNKTERLILDRAR